MTHEQQLRNQKYINWVKGGLAIKYLRNGLYPFAESIAKSEHQRIRNVVGYFPGSSCTSCSLGTLKPKHKDDTIRAGNSTCYLGAQNCHCRRRNNNTECQQGICDAIYDEIVKAHGTKKLRWTNTDVTQWSTDSWSIAKCFINAHGYDQVATAADTDIVGLLHLFINGTQYQNSLSCGISFVEKIKEWRNDLFHSPKMEIEDHVLTEGITDIQELLEDDRELKNKEYSKQSVSNIKMLLSSDIRITMEDEAEVCKAAIDALRHQYERLRHQQERLGEEVHEVQEDVQRQLTELSLRVDRNETDIRSLDKRVTEIETQLRVREIHLEKTEKRIELQKKLKDVYERRYLKTSASPLGSKEDDIDISNVYVQPNMAKEIQETSLDGRTRSKTEVLSVYSDILKESDRTLKKIYVIGNVGVGKTALCKMMISSWCKSLEESQPSNKVLKRFELLFYVPLLRVQEKDNIQQMLSYYYDSIMDKKTCSNIFQFMPERCLILLDGLDEWIPPPAKTQREHETLGLPRAQGMEDTYIVTTSRPSAQGILNLQQTDFDLKVYIYGINDIKKMVENYMSIMSKHFTDEGVTFDNDDDLLSKIQCIAIPHLETAPLLLQHIIWLLCKGKEVGHSISDVYSQIVNIALRWYENKYGDEDQSVGQQLRVLPDHIKKNYDSFSEHEAAIMSLGNLAFDVVTKQSPLYIGRSKLKEYKIGKKLLSKILNIGFLTEDACADKTQRNTQVTFTNSSLIEYFAALYIASNKQKEETQETKRSYQAEATDIVDDLFSRCASIRDVLDLGNVLVMVSGLAPKKTVAIGKLLYKKAQNDGCHSDARQRAFSYSNINEYLAVAEQYQSTVFRCLNESKAVDPNLTEQMPLLDAVFKKGIADIAALISIHVAQETVRCIVCLDPEPANETNIPYFQNLETIIASNCVMSHDEFFIAEYVRNNLKLKNVCLFTISCNQHGRDCDLVLNLSEHDHLETVNLMLCDMFIERINASKLEDCSLSYIRTQDTGTQLFIIPESPPLSVLQLGYFSVSPEVFSGITSYVSLSKRLRKIDLERVYCRGGTAYSTVLSDHDQLECFRFVYANDFFIQDINTSNLVYCITSSPDILQSIKSTKTLEHLGLEHMDKDDVQRVVLPLSSPRLRSVTLKWVDCRTNFLKKIAKLKCLEYISLFNIDIDSAAWYKFVKSLLTSDHPVTVELTMLNRPVANEEKQQLRDHISKHMGQFEILDYGLSFKFRTKN